MKIIVFPYILSSHFSAVTIYPFIFLKDKNLKTDFVLINHEKIHIRQQIELFWLIFFLWFIVEFFYRFFQYRNFYQAYKNISFEREAYAQEFNLDYLSIRKKYGFIKYL